MYCKYSLPQIREEEKEEGEGSGNEKEKESSGEDDSDTEGKKNAIHANVSLDYMTGID